MLGGDRSFKGKVALGKGGLQERNFFNSSANILRGNMCLSAGILLQVLKASFCFFSGCITWSNTPQLSLVSAHGAVPFLPQENVCTP